MWHDLKTMAALGLFAGGLVIFYMIGVALTLTALGK